MQKIKILSPELANQIAAGEVIERPSSVVKELVENALDAESTSIVVRIFEAGRRKIVVEDDGSGMDGEDAKLAFKRHATSKIRDEYDLFRIKTLGFRGEALPSIAAISQLTLLTSTGEGVGTKIEMIDDNPLVTRIGKNKGTTVMVEELFYNTPARLKYLKKDYTENANSTEIMQRLALAHPDVAFALYIDERLIFQTSGRGDVLEVIMNLFGTYVAKRMCPITLNHPDFQIAGFLGKAELMRSNRYSIITLLNGRNVYMPKVQKAIIDAYHGFIPANRYPFVVLHLEVDPHLVDVNVHPSKREVRFSKEQELEKMLKSKIPAILREDRQVVALERPVKKEEGLKLKDQQLTFFDDFLSESATIEEKTLVEGTTLEKDGENQLRIIPFGQIGHTYIIGHDEEGGFYLLDQHAVAERINYEKFQKVLNSDLKTKEPLVPLIIDLSSADYARLTPQKQELLAEVGIRLSEFGPHTFKVSEIPIWGDEFDERLYVMDLLDAVLHDHGIDINKLRSQALATMACKASIKANHRLNITEMNYLINELSKCANPYACPHGRPTIVHITNAELAKWFKRTG
ncbi:MAG: DNA mismatch repair endonuclease MutL [Bacilli bacterium]|jgi:DNA mismatch repair protein MutL